MYTHTRRLQYQASPERPDPVYAAKLQELIDGQYGEITVTMQYHPGLHDGTRRWS
ncbi:manganese catalase family protein [Pseudonocardia nantongensis]|uniref:manganese catalase family protein n=1 Tax=Pseudonocardia nantongensis TaxID=1181885 RepID=UPI0039780F42